MNSDSHSTASLLSDYRVSWKASLQRLVKFLLGELVSVETWEGKEIVVIQSKGWVLVQVSSIKSDQDGRQNVNIIFENTPRSLEICKDHSAIVIIAVIFGTGYEQRPGMLAVRTSPSMESFLRGFLLVWDWGKSPEYLQGRARYEASVETNTLVPGYLKEALSKAIRLHNAALILRDLEEYKEAEKRQKEAIEGYKVAFREEDPQTLAAYGDLALIYKIQRRWLDVEKLFFLKVIETTRGVQGTGHQDTLSSIANPALIYIDKVSLTTEELEIMEDLVKFPIKQFVRIKVLDLIEASGIWLGRPVATSGPGTGYRMLDTGSGYWIVGYWGFSGLLGA
ncbi:hypothetical protein B0O99DRAFT_688940 [Bisporella sp. PMI_857]|nr:hypothetical protein B0O99DRAFT_688940 [Bisporella sp. PMI_857]